MTPGQAFTLTCLQTASLTGRQISQQAAEAGLNTATTGKLEWADRHLSWLRTKGYAAHTGTRHERARVHRITAAGRKVLLDQELRNLIRTSPH